MAELSNSNCQYDFKNKNKFDTCMQTFTRICNIVSRQSNCDSPSTIFGTYDKYVDAGLYVTKPIEYLNQFMEEWFDVDWLRGIVQNQQDLDEEYQNYLFIGDLNRGYLEQWIRYCPSFI